MWQNQHLCFSSERFYLFVCLCVRQETLKQRGNIRGGKGPSNEFVYFFFIWNVLFVYLFVSQPRDSETEVECTKVAKGQVMCLCVFFHPTGFVCLFVCVSLSQEILKQRWNVQRWQRASQVPNGAGRAKISLSWRTLVSQLFTTLGLQLQLQFQTILGLVQLATVSDNYQAKWGGSELFVVLCLCLGNFEFFRHVAKWQTYNVRIKESWVPCCVWIRY